MKQNSLSKAEGPEDAGCFHPCLNGKVRGAAECLRWGLSFRNLGQFSVRGRQDRAHPSELTLPPNPHPPLARSPVKISPDGLKSAPAKLNGQVQHKSSKTVLYSLRYKKAHFSFSTQLLRQASLPSQQTGILLVVRFLGHEL